MSIDEEEPELRPIKPSPPQNTVKKEPAHYFTPLNSNPINPQTTNPWKNPSLLSNNILPSYFRPVSTHFPISQATAQATHLPFGLVINPGLVSDVPITDLSSSTLVRCPRCSAHLCPFCRISSDCRRWKCAICGGESMFLNVNVSERKEVTTPILDMIVPKNYMPHEKAGPSFLFIFDISYDSISHGFAQSAAASLLSSLESLNDDTFVSIMTINDKLTIYDIYRNRRAVYVDLDSLKDEIYSHVCTLQGNREKVTSMLKEIQNLTIDHLTQDSDSKTQTDTFMKKGHCFGSALEAASVVLQEIGGVAMAFVYNYATVGPRAVAHRSRDEMVNEIALLKMSKTENSMFYANISKTLAKSAISLHLFAGSDEFADLAIMGVPCGLTAGKCHFYKNFQPMTHSNELHREIYRTLTTKYLWDATMKLRISNGVTVRRIHSNCQMYERDMMCLPAMTPEDSFTYELDILPHVTTHAVTFQFALAWNNNSRQRIIRIFTFSLPISEDPLEILRNVDEGALTTLLTKRTIPILLAEGAVAAAKLFVHETKLLTVNKHFKSVPQFTYGILQSSYLAHNFPSGPDGRFAHIIQMRSAGIVDLMLYSYPRLLTIENELVSLSKTATKNHNFLILHSNDAVYVWGKTKEILSQETSISIDENTHIIDVSTLQNEQLKKIIHECWEMSRRFLLTIAIYGLNALDGFLVEDAISDNFLYSSWIQPFNPNLSNNNK
ncbi:Sec23/Sec24 trunk domain containing protein [Tritrichomonas foetus]|uniref:Sec23/Sec24 trunk domain containing protein n=1 Tax=Tritrichomonas foetus TaxID=1144522 RepID=A0A1J4KXQ9_9EUKA|nr:Sec23/Sec24 trunk domain containing protein [Tritrichomonas foetus]|eukprot:OHT16023.1 Sec23/Sec24 trunk domain containing protein [Tritrichomonas foetus]